MKTQGQWAYGIALTVVAAGVGIPAALAAKPIEGMDEAIVLFEENTTDGDLGFHFKVDGDAWKRVLLFDPANRLILNLGLTGSKGVAEFGLTELFSESAEPGYDEVPREDFLAAMQEGEYTFVAIGLDNTFLLGTAELTKNIPAGAVITAPEEDEVIDAGQDLTVEWEPVPDPAAPDSVIEFYEVVVETDDEEEDVLFQLLTVILPADATRFTVPAEFLQPGRPYKVEIIAEESSNNRAASEVAFETADED